MIVGVLIYSGLSCPTYLLTENQISKKEFQFRFGGCYQESEISRFTSGVAEAWSVTIRILIQI